MTFTASRRPEGRDIQAFLDKHARTMIAVLQLPEDPAEYLRGRSRQAVRTNITKSLKLGLSVAAATPTQARRAAEEALAAGTDITALDAFNREAHAAGMIDWIGRDGSGTAIAFARVQVDGTVAMLKCLVAIRNDPRSVVRYQLSATIFQSLTQMGVRSVIMSARETDSQGLSYFGQRLGFRQWRGRFVVA